MEEFDVLIVGAGVSGIGSACHLRTQCPEKSFLILEAMDTFGGTWVTHRFPGIRSDSDLYTYGYRFKPWSGAPIATGAEILQYLGETIEENDLAGHIRYQHQIRSADWSSEESCWLVEATRTDTGEMVQIRARFLWMCQGYYRHSTGYTPEWKGMERSICRIVHPQHWPDDLDYSGKTVVVIGSGATVATLVPAIASACKHVTLLQRSPTYYFPRPNDNELADMLRALEIPPGWIHEIVRRKILYDDAQFTRRTFTDAEAVKQELLAGVRTFLGDDYDIAKHFTPHYRPWQQRLAVIPDGDLLQAIRAGKVTVVTDEIDQFDETGILLRSGDHLAADIIVTATGFNVCVLGDIAFAIDGRPLVLADTVAYRGMMFTGVPNLVWVFGYLRMSWTLRVDLIGDFVCRLLQHMDRAGAVRVTPALRQQDQSMPLRPWIEAENFNAGYLQRSVHLLPKQGDRAPWEHVQDYQRDKQELPAADLDDGLLYA
jgi:cation diffusion facilitator CzcD-associated flavoprotein CzcO